MEVCAIVQSMKYIHKYIYKDSDRAIVEVATDIDAIKQYLDARYVDAGGRFGISLESTCTKDTLQS